MAAPRLRCRSPVSRSNLLTTSNLSIHGVHRWWLEMREVHMHKSLAVLGAALVGCSTPAYRAAEVPVPAAYSINTASVTAAAADATPSIDVPTGAIHVSTELASAPFWTSFGDSTLTMLI